MENCCNRNSAILSNKEGLATDAQPYKAYDSNGSNDKPRLNARIYATLLQVTAPNFEINTTNGFEIIYDFLGSEIRALDLQLFTQNLIQTPNFLYCTPSVTVNKIMYFVLSQIFRATPTGCPFLRS